MLKGLGKESDKKALIVATVIEFITGFEMNDIRLLQELGYQVSCATNLDNPVDQDRIEQLRENGVRIYNIPFSRSPISKQNIYAYKELRNLMHKERFDMMHCHTPVGGVLGRIAAHKEHVPHILYTAHGFHFYNGAPLKNWLIFYPVEKILSHYTDTLITINNEDYELACAKFKAKENARIPGVGIDLKRFSPKHDTDDSIRKELGITRENRIILSVGELNENKNHRLIISALAKYGDKNIHYVIAGSGITDKKNRILAKELGVSKQVHFLGYRTDIPELDNVADVFAFPSIREGLGLAAIEALACGTPVIGMNTRGINEYVKDGVTGYLFNNDVDSCCEAIVNCLKLKEDSLLSAHCMDEAKKYDFQNSQIIMKTLYEKYCVDEK